MYHISGYCKCCNCLFINVFKIKDFTFFFRCPTTDNVNSKDKIMEEITNRVFTGTLENLPELQSTVVRIFLSSTFTGSTLKMFKNIKCPCTVT